MLRMNKQLIDECIFFVTVCFSIRSALNLELNKWEMTEGKNKETQIKNMKKMQFKSTKAIFIQTGRDNTNKNRRTL